MQSSWHLSIPAKFAKRCYMVTFGCAYLVGVHLVNMLRSRSVRRDALRPQRTRLSSFFIVLTVSSVVLSGCTRDPNVRKQKYYKSGVEYFQNGKYSEAGIELRNALKVDPHFADAAAMLAK